MKPKIKISDEELADFCDSNGGQQVWQSWKEMMLVQHREVESKRLNWGTLSYRDKELDKSIAFEVIQDFITWYNGHPHK
jgi:hypothetical protein